MNSTKKIGSAVLVCALSLFALRAAGAEDKDEPWKKVCDQAAQLQFPAGDRPGAEDKKNLKDCSAYDLYYGFYEGADPAKARLCAYNEMENPNEAGPFNGAAMLMTIYANGVGAKRNFDLAIKLACKVGGAPMEIEGRIKHLQELKAKNWQGSDFSLCDDITSGYMAGFCSDHREKFAALERSGKYAKIQEKWTDADRKAFDGLVKVMEGYSETHAENEVDTTGSAHTALYIDDKAAQEDAFLKMLQQLEQGKFPAYSQQQYTDADARLNAAYKKVQKEFDPGGGSLTKEGIKTTQREWIKYRDAWVKFCQKKYPRCTPESIKTHLTLTRIKELEEF